MTFDECACSGKTLADCSDALTEILGIIVSVEH